jgi:hypothetical protein
VAALEMQLQRLATSTHGSANETKRWASRTASCACKRSSMRINAYGLRYR